VSRRLRQSVDRARVRRSATAILAALLCIGALGSCRSSIAPHAAAATAAPPRTSGPLAGGLEIAEGSALLGTVFENGGSWFALLRIDGDPRQVLDGYRTQLERVLGVPVRPASATGCGPKGDVAPFDVLCRSAAATSARWVGLRALISENEHRNYLSIDWSETSPNGPAQTPPPLTSGAVAPATGARLAPSYSADHLVLRVVEGSRLLGDPLPTDPIGYTAVLAVTGDPAVVMRGYAGQLRDGATTLLRDGRSIRATLDQAGGAHITIEATVGDTSFLRVSYSYD
jgi:hypothetical protein